MIIQVRPSQERVIAHFSEIIDAHVESVAKAKGYNSAASCASYVADPNPAWAAEATAFVAWRSAVWAAAFSLMASQTTVPTEQEVMAALPVIDWP